MKRYKIPAGAMPTEHKDGEFVLYDDANTKTEWSDCLFVPADLCVS